MVRIKQLKPRNALRGFRIANYKLLIINLINKPYTFQNFVQVGIGWIG